ncbi:MAG TPA: WG repeat-containing protein, partial [Flavobacteriales bacterium]|nr:WG repeat-containing protein [Flavobacteriales bacterium]
AWVVKEAKYGYIDRSGALVIPLQFTEAGDFHENMAKVKYYNGELSTAQGE